ncbi:MAG TPA: ribose 5-phosphate isomerase B [Armatimonadota bacterium]|nr:ribose 5-phosphate isomerase B [Armatimonadota bacterium]
MRVAVGSDHAGFPLKEAVISFLGQQNVDFKDFGAYSPDSVDYPDIGFQVAEAVANGDFDRGILICGTGIGMSIAANKAPGIRAALCKDTYCALVAREHNDANILCLGSRTTEEKPAFDITRTFLATDFSGEERHAKRIRKITEIERKGG